jgi:hypothetical protein
MYSIEIEQTRALWRSSPFQWGTDDCILSVCEFVRLVTGVDPAEPWRGSYSDEEGAIEISAPFGGNLALFEFGMGNAGFEVCDPKDGYPVIAEFLGHEIAGLSWKRRVMFRIEGRGLLDWPAPIVKAWAI